MTLRFSIFLLAAVAAAIALPISPAAARSRDHWISRENRPARRRPTRMFSSTVISGTRPRDWCTTATPAARASSGRTGSRSGTPSTSIRAPGSAV